MKEIQKELALRALAKKSLKHFVLLKWERYEKKGFLDNWHYDYLCHILESTLPTRDSVFSDKGGSSEKSLQSFTSSKILCDFSHNPPFSSKSLESPPTPRDFASTGGNDFIGNFGQIQNTQKTTQHSKDNIIQRDSGSICEEKSGVENYQTLKTPNRAGFLKDNQAELRACDFVAKNGALQGERRELPRAVMTELETKQSPFLAQKQSPITRLMINMPPSYGKTEIIARCFIAWALGHYPNRKFFYISYSDDLCRKISNQVRDLLKSPFFATIFGKNPQFLQDNANEFILKEGGGLFVTTLKSALTGFHAHQILIDDPIKVSEMNSKAEREKVNQNFKESVLSRLQDNQSNITILMQRLGDSDLCGFLLDEKHFSKDIINQWKQVSLKAINESEELYSIGDYEYVRKAKSALFPLRHTLQELEHLKLQMGNDEFSTQYQQDPQVSEAGYFESVYFKEIPSYECGSQNLYIFVDNAISLNSAADNRAIVLIGAESYKEAVRYVVRDCVYGIWSEEESISHIIDMMYNNPSAKVYIESDGGGLTLERLLLNEIVKVNAKHKSIGKNQIINQVKCYTPSRKVAKVEKIKALRPYYNTGYLVFLHNARGLNQIKKELFSFNPEKPFRKDDCIDAIASAVRHEEIYAPRAPQPQEQYHTRGRSTGRYYPSVWRV